MFERPESGENVVLVHVNLRSQFDSANDLEEFIALAESTLVEPVAVITANRQHIEPKYYIGEGKVDELAATVAATQADCIIFNNTLTPSQQRNLEKQLKVRVLDRTQLILDIFAQRARTHEGKLQVELAQLQYMSTRLVRGWTHLERQKGGIGLRGPGETQLETDRRLIRGRIHHIQKRLAKVRQQRLQSRKRRQRKPVPVVSLVGYTNAGKSTLFNQLTCSEVYAADQLFATLDPTLRSINIDQLGEVVLADTVGFIRHLPHDLVEAFQATLEETREADLLIHVVDASAEDSHDTIAAVNTVLEEIGAGQVPQIKIYNKIDKLDDSTPRQQDKTAWISAAKNAGLELVIDLIRQELSQQYIETTLTLTAAQGSDYAYFHRIKAIVSEENLEQGGWELVLRLPNSEWQRWLKRKEG